MGSKFKSDIKQSLCKLYEAYGILSINESYKLATVRLARNYIVNYSGNSTYNNLFALSERCKQNGEIFLINPKVKYSNTKNSYSYRIVGLWNSISKTIRRFDTRCFKLRVQMEIVADRDDARMYVELYHR